MTKKRKIIMVPRGSIAKICEEIGCKKTLVFNALSYNVDSEQARKVRDLAIMKYNGIITSKPVL